MDTERFERIFFIVLCGMLLLGSGLLYFQVNNKHSDIVIVSGGMNKHYSMDEMRRKLHEQRKISINNATKKVFENVPGIGPSLADRIVDYRVKHGGFGALSDLQKVNGIGEKKMKQMKDFIKM
jgi:comEA protein